MARCFRPGDVIKAKVLFHSDAYGFCLSTKDHHLGVIHAESFNGTVLIWMANSQGHLGVKMVVVDQNAMKCPVTHTHESRKVAMQ